MVGCGRGGGVERANTNLHGPVCLGQPGAVLDRRVSFFHIEGRRMHYFMSRWSIRQTSSLLNVLSCNGSLGELQELPARAGEAEDGPSQPSVGPLRQSLSHEFIDQGVPSYRLVAVAPVCMWTLELQPPAPKGQFNHLPLRKKKIRTHPRVPFSDRACNSLISLL